MAESVIDWSRHFDRAYCFHFVKDAARLPGITEEFRRVGLLDSGIFSFVYTSPDPWEKRLVKACPECASRHGARMGFLNLGLATARTFREALALRYRRVLFLEDDIRFLKDIGEIAATLDAIPDGFDIVQLEHFVDAKQIPDEAAYAKACAERGVNDRFFDAGGLTMYSGGCVCLGAPAMAKMLRYMEDVQPHPFDGIMQSGMTRAAAKRNVAVQVALGDAMMWRYGARELRNDHHASYAPQGVRYEDYAVPDGYGYGSLFCGVERGSVRVFQDGEVAPPAKRASKEDWEREFQRRHAGETFENKTAMLRKMEEEREAAERARIVGMRDAWSAQGLVDLVSATGASAMRVVEVGSYAGESAEIFASMPQVAEVWCVDTWAGGYDGRDAASFSDFAEVEAAFDEAASRHPGKIRKFKGTLREFVDANPGLAPDLVYIDAEHTYDGCARDVAAALEWDPPFLSGHDYNAESWPGVVRAVDELLGGPDATFRDTSWLKRRKGG